MNMRLHENSVRLGMETKYLFKITVNIKKNNSLLNSFCSSIFIATGKFELLGILAVLTR